MALQQARSLNLPDRSAMLRRDPAVQQFWEHNHPLLQGAWEEWEAHEQHAGVLTTDRLIDSRLRDAVQGAWSNPNKDTESAVSNLWQEVSPGVYQAQFFDPERLAELRAYLAAAADAGIPTRPPYGIALNRHGAMLDQRSEGYLAAPRFQDFYRDVMNTYMRPISRLLFPEVLGYDTQTFGFSIQYQPGMDTSLQPHTDASAATLNINMNTPDETFTGSELDFYDPVSSKANRLRFEPGVAMLHRGSVAHAAQPITGGQRTNMVLWLYGDRMQIPRHVKPAADISARQRWQVPHTQPDSVAPF